MKGGGGIRKIRVAVGSRGKSGGARHLSLSCTPGFDFVALRVSQEHYAGSESKQIAHLAKVVKEEFGDEKRRCLKKCWAASARLEEYCAGRENPGGVL